MKRTLGKATLYVTALALAQPALAEPNFCGSDDPCMYAYAKNEASATVTGVNITQEQGDSSCFKEKKYIKQTLSGGTGMEGGQAGAFKANTNCKYKVVFKTTGGCTGDKVIHLRPKNFDNGRNVVKLKGACGSLTTKVGAAGRNAEEIS